MPVKKERLTGNSNLLKIRGYDITRARLCGKSQKVAFPLDVNRLSVASDGQRGLTVYLTRRPFKREN